MDRDDFNTKNTAALNLASGYAIYPHYDETADQQILTFVTDTSIPVLAIPEGSGVWVSADLQAISSVWCFDAYGKKAQLAELKDLEC